MAAPSGSYPTTEELVAVGQDVTLFASGGSITARRHRSLTNGLLAVVRPYSSILGTLAHARHARIRRLMGMYSVAREDDMEST